MLSEQDIASYKIDLSFLLAVGDDSEFLNEMVNGYSKQTPEFIENLRDHLQNHNFTGITEICHQIKSSYGIAGMQELDRNLQAISEILHTEAPPIERVTYFVNVIILLISLITEEIKRLAENLNK